MANTFTYRGLDETGKAVRGELIAENVHSAAVLLKSQGLFPTEVTAAPERASRVASGGSLWGTLSGRNIAADVTILTRQLATLVGGARNPLCIKINFSAMAINLTNQLRISGSSITSRPPGLRTRHSSRAV